MRQWRNGVGNAPRHYSGTRSAADRALSRTRSLTAAAVAVAMMATVAITSLIPAYNAKADENNLEGSKCIPTSYTLGDTSGTANGEDTGVATYVGRDLYVGKNTNKNTNINDKNNVDGSYAVEAEGLTVVNGKLVMKPLKDSWKAGPTSAGFRWGTVGFGSQFRPGDGKTVLAIGGTGSGIDTLTSGEVRGNVGAYVKGGFVGQSFTQWDGNNRPTGPALGYKYKASIAGKETKWSSNTDRSSIVATQGDWKNDANGDVTFNASNPLEDVNGTDYTNYKDYLKSKLSEPLSKLRPTGYVDATGTAREGTITRYKYNYPDNPISFRFIYDGGSTTVDNKSARNNEKLITFKGNSTSAMQVFNIEGTDLSSIGYRGVDFEFVNIPENASIVINVSGDDIDFHTGWRFWWNGIDIGGGFSKYEPEEIRKLYSSAAQKIMWNFKDAKNVTIRGGVANESKNENDGNNQSKNTTDDPAAAMLGSILVPHGSFESHVSTNGRVYVGQDFMMYNPTAIKYEKYDAGWEGRTASVLNMDQERHNLPWNGQMTTSCAAIKWDKVDAAGTALTGTSWTVYGTKDNAVNSTNPIATVADGGWNDADNANNGSVTLGSLEKNATYYVRESGTSSSQYALNTNIYRIVTQNSTNTVSTIDKVYTDAGAEITKDAAKQLHDGAIVNVSAGTSIAWSKVDAEDPNALLAGSTWELTKKSNPDQSWTIADDDSDSKIANIVVKITKAAGTLPDEDSKAGKFKVSNLADDTYYLQETVAPNGYEASGAVYTITIKNGQATWNSVKTGNKLPNKRKTGMVTWNKVDKTDGTKLLGGSEWKLIWTKSFSWVNGKASYKEKNRKLATIKDCVDSSATQCDISTEAYADIGGKAGQFKIKGLAWGEYQLVETKAPDGFNLDSTPHMFRIGPVEGSDVTGKWYTSSDFKTDSTSAYNANTAFTVGGGSITNTPGVVLPGTGGEGLNKMYAAGFLAVAIAVAGLALSLRRRQS